MIKWPRKVYRWDWDRLTWYWTMTYDTKDLTRQLDKLFNKWPG